MASAPQDLLQQRCFSGPCRHDRHLFRRLDERVGQGDPLGRRFGRIENVSDDLVRLSEQRVPRKEGRRVSVLPHAQQQEVKRREPPGGGGGHVGADAVGILGRCVFGGGGGGIVGKHLGGGDGGGELGEEVFAQALVVGVSVIERYTALIDEEDVPLAELDSGAPDDVGAGELGEGTSREGNAEAVARGNGRGRLLGDVLSEGLGDVRCGLADADLEGGHG
mmetsp:Transcript_1484/g.3767  ORF Transcript_1484/g.3767 Transcript_1484/m.3767 type:complete len:221 (+) Transcript_1484:270-932(+)